MNLLRNLINKVKADSLEYYTLALISLGLPLVAYLYFDWRAVIASVIVIQIVIGVMYLRRAN